MHRSLRRQRTMTSERNSSTCLGTGPSRHQVGFRQLQIHFGSERPMQRGDDKLGRKGCPLPNHGTNFPRARSQRHRCAIAESRRPMGPLPHQRDPCEKLLGMHKAANPHEDTHQLRPGAPRRALSPRHHLALHDRNRQCQGPSQDRLVVTPQGALAAQRDPRGQVRPRQPVHDSPRCGSSMSAATCRSP